MAVIHQDYELYLFDNKNRLINRKAILANGVSVEAITPEIKKQFELFPLGTVSAMIIYDEVGNFIERLTIADYLENNIPRKEVDTKPKYLLP